MTMSLIRMKILPLFCTDYQETNINTVFKRICSRFVMLFALLAISVIYLMCSYMFANIVNIGCLYRLTEAETRPDGVLLGESLAELNLGLVLRSQEY